MTANEAIEYIHSVSWLGSKPGLGRTRELLQRMGDPQKKLRFIHIAGTNGKGSTAAMLASVLQRAGYRTGLYTSPYIFRFHERMQVNGREISDEMLAACTEKVKSHAEKMAEHPTEFELVTAIAMEYFLREKTDIVVLEAGMGGELDSTNVIPAPEAAVITNIGLDHTQYLGNTLEEIAATKAGIIKAGSGCVLYPSTKAVEKIVQKKCDEEKVLLLVADCEKIVPVSADLDGQSFDFGTLKGLKIGLLGKHQLCNAAVVLATLSVLKGKGWNIPTKAVYEGLAEAKWPGRFDILCRDPLFIVDGGHNPQCIAALVQNIRDFLPEKPLTLLTGVMADKDRSAMYPALLPYTKRFVTVTPDNPRALPAEELAAELRALGASAEARDTVFGAVQAAAAYAKAENGAVLTCGSLYMVGQIADAVKQL